MTDKLTEDEEFSRELLRAISATEREVEVDLPLLAGRDLAVLKQILRGEKSPRVPVDRKRAINALTRSERSAEAGEILAGILSNAEESEQARVVAAINLTLMPAEVAERALLRDLTSESELVREEVIKSLGRIATGEGLDRLKELPVPEDEYERRQLVFARVVTGMRTGAQEPDVRDLLGIRWTEHPVRPLEGKPVEEGIDSIWGSTYGIALNPEIGFEIRCGRMSHFLFLNADIKRGALVESLRSRPMVAGVVALREEDVKHASVRYLLLTTPSQEGVDVIVARTNGQVAYAGEARPEGEVLRLELRDVGLERAPASIEGFLSDDDVRVTVRVWRGATRRPKHGEPVRV